MTKMCPVVHFEMPYEQCERMAKFYQRAFGWQTQMLDEEMGNYVLATTSEMDGSSPKRPGTINGGFFQKRPDWPAQYPSVVIGVDDIQDAIKPVGMVEGLDSTYSAAIFLGYHSRAGTPNGFIAHTGTGAVKGLWLNDIEVGEGELNAAYAGSVGVPVIMAAGSPPG